MNGDVIDVRWLSLAEPGAREDCSIRFENDGWTIDGTVTGQHACHYVIRLSADFAVRQFILFRDMEDPDLWLATDGHGRWGEVNGAHRPDLDGCTDVDLRCTPLTRTLPIRRLPLLVGDAATVKVAEIDVETLGVVGRQHTYVRTSERSWSFRGADASAEMAPDGAGLEVQFDVDDHGLVVDYPNRFARLA